MKTYGLSREDSNWYYTTRYEGWSGQQSRKVAKRRRNDKKLLHQVGRSRLRQQLREMTRDGDF